MVGNACASITGDYSTWGACFQEAIFFDSAAVATIGLIFIIAFFAFKFRLPQEVTIPLAVMTAFIMTFFNPTPEMWALDAILMLIVVATVVFGMLRTGGR